MKIVKLKNHLGEIGFLARHKNQKYFRSNNYNFNFDYNSGFTQKWGRTTETKDDPAFSPFGPELADLEITTICAGPKLSNGTNQLCRFCYKSNTTNGLNMSFETFKSILNKFPHGIDDNGKKHFVLNQIAIGCDSSCTSNPDTWKIFQYCRDNDIVPNLTVASIDDEVASKIASLCGACAVSRYSDKDVCYNTIDSLSNKYKMRYVNMHMLVSEGTKDMIWETLKDIKTDPRLSKLTAIVFLALKRKGRGISQKSLSQEEYSKIVRYCLDNNISFGGDSCGAGKIYKSLNQEEQSKYGESLEPCEAACHSFYADVEGKYYPCSFMANEVGDWTQGIDILKIEDFYKDLWYNDKVTNFRGKVLNCNQCLGGCCHFKI